MYFDNKNKLVVTYYEAFAGLGATSVALNMIQRMLPQYRFVCVGHCENDKTANLAYEVMNGEIHLDKDITTVDFSTLPQIDFLSWTAPCTSISSAGRREGFDENSKTASSLIWEIKRLLAVQKPSIIFFENVKNIETSKKFKSTWLKFKGYLEEEGYHLHYEVVDSAKYGWPQHRERFMMIATLEDISFSFPEESKLKLHMSELLDHNVDDKIKYKRTINSFIDKALGEGNYQDKPSNFKNMRIHSLNDATTAFTITTNPLRITENFVWDTNYKFPQGVLRVNKDNLESLNITREELHDAPIRRTTTRENMLLMGIPKKYHQPLIDAICMTKLYKLLGNSIVIPTLRDVLLEFFKSMYTQRDKLNIE